MTDLPARLTAALSDRYTIERELGSGGMATVYLAADAKHDRKVAIKVMKPELAAVIGGERFLSEIKTTAALQHPHILPLFDSGEADGFLYYVMPFVDGESLRQKLDRENQLGVAEAVKIAEAVASALNYAHERGIVHRDIKPANILIHAGQPVVADFGIALAISAAGGGRLTETGMSVGTPHYMSPEQATADRDVTARSDIYAVTSVLYEMLTGDPPHTGSNAQAVLMRILTEEPRDVSDVRKSVPPNVRAAITKGLEKLPADRFETADEFGRALGDVGFRWGEGTTAGAAAEGARSGTGWGRWQLVALSAIPALVVGLSVGRSWSAPPDTTNAPQRVSRYELAPPNVDELAEMNMAFGLSPEGESIVFAGSMGEDETHRLWIKHRDRLEWAPVPGSEGAWSPRFSPDGTRLAYLTASSIRAGTFVIPVAGGPPVQISEAPNFPAWIDDETVALADMDGLGRNFIEAVPASGGESHDIWTSQTWRAAGPISALPGGRGIIFSGCTECPIDRRIFALDATSGEAHELTAGLNGDVLTDGTLLITRIDGTVWAAALDLETLELEAEPVPVLQGIGTAELASGLVASPNGTLLMVQGPPAAAGVMTRSHEAIWVSRATGESTVISEGWRFRLAYNFGLALSPTDDRLALGIKNADGDDVWVKELPDGPLTRLTLDPANDARPKWSPDGRDIWFQTQRGGRNDDYALFRRRADGADQPVRFPTPDRSAQEPEPSADGEWMIVRVDGLASQGGSGRDIVAYRTNGDSTEVPLLTTEYDEFSPALSPDGRWLAYVSTLSGQAELYVRPFPNVTEGRWPISTNGGIQPLWKGDGSELYYVGRSETGRRMMAAHIETGTDFSVRSREDLFALPEGVLEGAPWEPVIDVSQDGERFVMLRWIPDDEVTRSYQLVIVENFGEELRGRVGN